MRLGAYDYLQKPLSGPAELRLMVQRALERHHLRMRHEQALADAAGAGGQAQLTYGAPAMEPVVAALRKVARTQATVLLTGESGTGKEVAARALHRWSERAAGPFAAVNCAALSETLLESELFGHEKGAFTGASARRRGRIELADGGTFFLDEIGELRPAMQAKLLRVLQERRFERVGSGKPIEADVRWVAATNRDLTAMVADGSFRADIYHRLAVFPIRLPPLRERREDIAPLARDLLVTIGAELGQPGLTLAPGVEPLLAAAPWPGNVRELRNALERAAILAEGSVLTEAAFALSDAVTTGPAPPGPFALAAGAGGGAGTLEDMERDAIVAALAAAGGHRKRTAEILGIGLRTLYEKLKRYDLG
jgi:two-component system response regulator FlrC